jgi:dihydroorotate dehydrogenase (NAD+) catalytic subunit
MEIFELAEVFGPSVLAKPPVAAYVPKTIMLQARPGNAPPRIVETPGGMLNGIGLPCEGLARFVEEALPRLLTLPCPLILSIGGFSVDEYVELATRLCDALDALAGGAWTARVGLELNISCPNVHSGCMTIGADPRETEAVVVGVRWVWPGLLVAKLTPNVSDIAAIGRSAVAAGADALSAVNTYKGLVLDRRTLKPYLGNVTGGLSGPAIKPLALRAVFELRQAVRVPLIGMGGVACVQDVLDFMACGATVVAVGSAALVDPGLASVLAQELEQSLTERGLTAAQLTGLAHRPA